MSKSNKRLEQTVKKHRLWLKNNGARIYERDLAYLKEDLKDGSPKAVKNIPYSLDTMGFYHGMVGVVQIIDTQDSGWESISASIGYYAWAIRIQAEKYLKDLAMGMPTIGVANHASLLACVASVSSSWTDTMLSLLIRLQPDEHFQSMTNRSAQRFEEFILVVYDKLIDVDAAGIDPSGTPYMSILDNWDSDNLASAFSIVCDYHCGRIEQAASDEFHPEFFYPPFDLLPCEWMFVRRVRDELGLPTPDLDHPLAEVLQPPQPDIATQIDPDIEDQLTKLFEQYFG